MSAPMTDAMPASTASTNGSKAEGPIFATLDAPALQADLLNLLCRTARENGRIEITNCGGGACVLISKDELDGLERALEILSNTDGAGKMREHLEECAICLVLT